MQSPGLEAVHADPGVRHLPELVRTRLDTWYPRRLPARFRPSRPSPAPRLLRPLLLALAALLLALLAAAALTGSPRALSDVIVNLGGTHPAVTPTPRQRIAEPAAPAQVQPAAVVSTPNLVTPRPASSPTLPAFGQVASAARVATRASNSPRPTTPKSTASLSFSGPERAPPAQSAKLGKPSRAVPFRATAPTPETLTGSRLSSTSSLPSGSLPPPLWEQN
jgi:hypothetical protein